MSLPSESTMVPFPRISTHSGASGSNLSVVSTRATALDVCYSVYGENPTSIDAVDRFYEANASTCVSPASQSHRDPRITLTDIQLRSYENPCLTATSRTVIGDIHRLSRQLSSVDVPRPLAVFCTLFRVRPPNLGYLGQNSADPLFQALRVWTDIGDICESESFDGHRKAIVEHTLNILLLPGIHRDGTPHQRFYASSDSLVNHSGSPHSQAHPQPFISPSLPIPGTSLSIPSPLHFQLHIVTRLSFNEQGRVTHHRDIWDVKDVMGLVPGVSLAQWIGTRLAAVGLSYAAKFLPTTNSHSYYSAHPTAYASAAADGVDLENGMKPSASMPPSNNALEITGI